MSHHRFARPLGATMTAALTLGLAAGTQAAPPKATHVLTGPPQAFTSAFATGDLNGDGLAEIGTVLPAPDDGSASAYVLGRRTPRNVDLTAPSAGVVTAPIPSITMPAGDVNADGRADVLYRNSVSSRVVFGPVALVGGVPAGSGFTLQLPPQALLSPAGDVDGDGRDDLVVLVQDPDTFATTGATVVYGRPGTAPVDTTAPGAGVSQISGIAATVTSIVGVGDVNGDGRDDLAYVDASVTSAIGILGAATRADVDVAGGGARIIRLATGTASTEVAPVGDVSGDGLADIALTGNPAYIAPGSRTPRSLDVTAPGAPVLRIDHAEGTIVPVGDTNGDGLRDVLVSGVGPDTAIRLVPGRRSAGIVDAQALPLLPDVPQGVFNLSTAGDVDGDGQPDALLGVFDDEFRLQVAVLTRGRDVMPPLWSRGGLRAPADPVPAGAPVRLTSGLTEPASVAVTVRTTGGRIVRAFARRLTSAFAPIDVSTGGLAPGGYRVSVVPSDGSLNIGRTKAATFTVTR